METKHDIFEELKVLQSGRSLGPWGHTGRDEYGKVKRATFPKSLFMNLGIVTIRVISQSSDIIGFSFLDNLEL